MDEDVISHLPALVALSSWLQRMLSSGTVGQNKSSLSSPSQAEYPTTAADW